MQEFSLPLTRRPRRNRKSKAVREMLSETKLSVSDFVYPVFIMDGNNKEEEIPSMPGITRKTIDVLLSELEEVVKLGILAIAPFPAIAEELKDSKATLSYADDGLVQRAIRQIKEKFPQLLVMTDVALDPFNAEGHDGIVSATGEILNDETVEVLCKMAVSHGKAGADFVCPSDMMDGRIGAIREALDGAGLENTSIMAYSAKYASAFYGPFRDALGSAPKAGDKKTYQMDPANVREAMLEVSLDIEEGADAVMVKPALPYLDVLSKVADTFDIPVSAYQVSGEYAMIVAAAQNGWLDRKAVVLESLLSIKRAGARFIWTYFAKEAAMYLLENTKN
ncbi:MAG: porphobilinogen synthase [Fibrobacteraceae bacterium]|nr:porphobilinogen synthase [Fibrobacteraceae bacterium]